MLFFQQSLSCSKEPLLFYQHPDGFPLEVVLKFNLQATHLIEVEAQHFRPELVLLLTHGSDIVLAVDRNAPITVASRSLDCTRDNMATDFIESLVHQKDCIHQRAIKRLDLVRGTLPP